MGKILEARYLNVDFLVEANFDLSSVVEALSDDVLFLWNETGIQSSSFGIEVKLASTTNPEEDIRELLCILERLPPNLKKLLQESYKKVFDIGFECGTLTKPLDTPLSAETVRRITKLDCSINFKIYPWVEHPYED